MPLDSGGGVFPPEVELRLGGTPLPPRMPETAGAVRTEDPASMVALGGTHSLVLTSSGKVFGFGRLEDDRLGVEWDPVREPLIILSGMYASQQVFMGGQGRVCFYLPVGDVL